MLRRFIAGLFLALLSFSSFAQTTCAEFTASYSSTVSGWHKTIPAAATELAAMLSESQDTSTYDFTFSFINYAGTGSSGSVTMRRTRVTRSTGVVQEVNATGAWQYRAAECQCPAGQTSQRTFFSGWSTDQEGTNMVGGDVLPPATYCDGQCSSTKGQVISCHSDPEVSPNGYYSGTCTWEYTTTGDLCTVPTEDPGPTPEPDPQNPGGPGDGDPGDGDPGGPGDGDPEDPGDGEPGDGSGPGDGGGECVPTEENPCDDGGSGGGDSGGGSGTDPGGSDGEDKGAECGVPGKPSCTVKVDETGTPTDLGQLRQSGGISDQADQKAQELRDLLDGIQAENVNPEWTWTFQLPSGCSPFQMPAFGISIDVCEYQPMIHDIMSVVWLMATVAALVAFFMRGA